MVFLDRSQNVRSKNIFFTLGFWVGLPQNMSFDFSVLATCLAAQQLSVREATMSTAAQLRLRGPVR